MLKYRHFLKGGKSMKEKGRKIIGILTVLIYMVTAIYLAVSIHNFGIIPNKYLWIMYFVMALFLVLLLFLLKREHLVFTILGMIASLLIGGGYFVATGYINTTNNALNKIVSNKITSVNYYVLVKRDSNIKSIEELKDKEIGYMKDNNSIKLEHLLTKKIPCKATIYEDYNKILSDFTEGTPIILNSGYVEALSDEMNSFSSLYNIIYTFTIEEEFDLEEDSEYKDITTEPFVVYLSGIDTYGDITTRSRSDVNILITVNPKTHKILLINTPRDYYVQLHGTTGLKDKLTHAGIYGIEKSVTTMEDLYETEINNYVRVNFNTLIKVVDQIGGIDINSDTSFTAHTNNKVIVQEGWNHFNGEQALAYSRERYAYASGDRHRGENQEQVITAIINKVTSTKTLISNYEEILNTLSNSFETDLSNNSIKKLAKMQLDKNIDWSIESISVDGVGASNYTYSMGTKQLLYVMVPDQNTLNIAKEKMNQVLNEK